jgi:hypothetical protein
MTRSSLSGAAQADRKKHAGMPAKAVLRIVRFRDFGPGGSGGGINGWRR